jgi:adenine-specific DNA-methyltransferase
VVGVGPEITRDTTYEKGPSPEGYLRVYPLGKKGLERVWRNSRESAERKIRSGELTLRCTANGTIVQIISGEKKKVPIRSVWSGPRFNAGERGSNLVRDITGAEFPYPKSLYTVLDCLKAAVGTKKNAVVLDFFAGSGTTMHALELLTRACGPMQAASNPSRAHPSSSAFPLLRSDLMPCCRRPVIELVTP